MKRITVFIVLLLAATQLAAADNPAPVAPAEPEPTRAELLYKKMYQDEHLRLIQAQRQNLNFDELLTKQGLEDTNKAMADLVAKEKVKEQEEKKAKEAAATATREKHRGPR